MPCDLCPSPLAPTPLLLLTFQILVQMPPLQRGLLWPLGPPSAHSGGSSCLWRGFVLVLLFLIGLLPF